MYILSVTALIRVCFHRSLSSPGNGHRISRVVVAATLIRIRPENDLDLRHPVDRRHVLQLRLFSRIGVITLHLNDRAVGSGRFTDFHTRELDTANGPTNPSTGRSDNLRTVTIGREIRIIRLNIRDRERNDLTGSSAAGTEQCNRHILAVTVSQRDGQRLINGLRTGIRIGFDRHGQAIDRSAQGGGQSAYAKLVVTLVDNRNRERLLASRCLEGEAGRSYPRNHRGRAVAESGHVVQIARNELGYIRQPDRRYYP